MAMISIDLKARLRNKTFWCSMIGTTVLLVQQLGVKAIPDNYAEVANSVLTILAMLGILVDTSTPGISDKTTSTTIDTTQTSGIQENKTKE